MFFSALGRVFSQVTLRVMMLAVMLSQAQLPSSFNRIHFVTVLLFPPRLASLNRVSEMNWNGFHMIKLASKLMFKVYLSCLNPRSGRRNRDSCCFPISRRSKLNHLLTDEMGLVCFFFCLFVLLFDIVGT